MSSGPIPRATAVITPSLVVRLDPTAVHIVVIGGDLRERTALLQRGRDLIVGSAPECDVVVDDATVSRQHAKFALEGVEVRITDLGSTNGVWYEGARVKLGRTTVHLRPHESEVRGGGTRPQFGGLVAEDRRMREMFALLSDVASVDATVIVEGETGTGKELVARAIHDASPRAQRPFVVFDCTTIPRDLVESAAFGHVKGAFTGATGSREGAFRRAHGGTIFFDEIGELPLDLQPKLLRVLETRTVQPVGGDEPEKVDVRVIAATNRDLRGEVRAGRFREDLYYRLAVVRVKLPALRERLDDLEVLARHFARLFWEQHQKPLPVPVLDPLGLERLKRHSFPGNVRELRNLVERALSLTKEGSVDLSRHLPASEEPTNPKTRRISQEVKGTAAAGRIEEVRAAVADALASPRPFKDAKALIVEAFERAFLSALVEKYGGNLSRAADAAQMDRKHLRDLLRRHQLRGVHAGQADE